MLEVREGFTKRHNTRLLLWTLCERYDTLRSFTLREWNHTRILTFHFGFFGFCSKWYNLIRRILLLINNLTTFSKRNDLTFLLLLGFTFSKRNHINLIFNFYLLFLLILLFFFIIVKFFDFFFVFLKNYIFFRFFRDFFLFLFLIS